MIVRIAVIIEYLFVLSSMCCSTNCTSLAEAGGCIDTSRAGVEVREASNATGPFHRRHRRICLCRRYRCSCCINFSFIRRWKALGCFHIESLPGNLNILLSFSFNKRHLAVFPIAGSRPMPFCRSLSPAGAGATACLVVYNVRTDTPHDVTLCLYVELLVGRHCVATVHLDCIRKVRRRIQFIPVSSHQRKGSVLDVHVMPNDTKLTILRQEFHWTGSADEESDIGAVDQDADADADAGSKKQLMAMRSLYGFLQWILRPVRLFW